MQEMQGTQFQSLGQEDPLEKEMETHSSILAWDDPLDRPLVFAKPSVRIPTSQLGGNWVKWFRVWALEPDFLGLNLSSNPH